MSPRRRVMLPYAAAPVGEGVVLTTGVLGTGVLTTGVLGTGVLTTGVLGTGVLTTGVLTTGVLTTGVLDTGALVLVVPLEELQPDRVSRLTIDGTVRIVGSSRPRISHNKRILHRQRDGFLVETTATYYARKRARR
ncbi:merozoite surface protein 1, putative, partial [Perkinsus marinus ATCC 50983]